LSKNKTLNIIESNQLIPTWLKKHLKSNKIVKSKVTLGNKNTGTEFDMFMPTESKFYEYHKLGLSLDGGGMRGLLLASELEYLAKEVGYPLHKIFDVIGGTSIGGILALTISTSLDNNHPIMNPP
jgi:predicted acylesterase/phospholipase RssA